MICSVEGRALIVEHLDGFCILYINDEIFHHTRPFFSILSLLVTLLHNETEYDQSSAR